MVLGIAKMLLNSINKGTLDDFTKKVFKKQRNRKLIHHIGESNMCNSSTAATTTGNRGSTAMSEQNRGRIRRLKQKVWILMKRPRNIQRITIVNNKSLVEGEDSTN